MVLGEQREAEISRTPVGRPGPLAAQTSIERDSFMQRLLSTISLIGLLCRRRLRAKWYQQFTRQGRDGQSGCRTTRCGRATIHRVRFVDCYRRRFHVGFLTGTGSWLGGAAIRAVGPGRSDTATCRHCAKRAHCLGLLPLGRLVTVLQAAVGPAAR